MKTCSYCNKQNAESAKFCYHCGHILPCEDESIKRRQDAKETVERGTVVIGIICIIVGLILSFTGVGAAFGLPIGLGGVYFISHAKEM